MCSENHRDRQRTDIACEEIDVGLPGMSNFVEKNIEKKEPPNELSLT